MYTVSQKLAVKVAMVIPNHSRVLDKHLAMVGVNFSSTASNWCPMLAPIAHSWLYRPVKEPSGKQISSSWPLHRYFLCVGISICNKTSFSFGVSYVGICSDNHVLPIRSNYITFWKQIHNILFVFQQCVT